MNSNKMQITAWGINYPPEKVGIAPCSAALCEFLAETGHQVTMLTSFPDLAEGAGRSAQAF
jgi:hypothetical protein